MKLTFLGKGFVQQPNKQRPVAKIMAKTRETPATANSMNSLSDYDPKSMMQLKNTSTELGINQTGDCGGGNGSAEQNFPFANDNVGTIRMRSNR